jgi:Ca2+-binding RTX toxin-like protein
VLRGGAGADTLRGLGGDDILNGGAGADKLEGQAGLDTADYSGAKQGVEVVLALGEGLSGAGDATGDTFVSIENVTGSAFADRLQGDDGANVVKGGGGNDFILGGPGFDVLDGGDGVDTIIYFGSGTGVVINLNTNTVSGDLASGDSISHFENAQGSGRPDMLVGDAGANRLDGDDGADTILGLGGNDVIAGGNGADVLDGGEGVDTLDYSRSSVRVRFDLGINFADAEGDTIKGFENLIGSRGDDSVAGSAVANTLSLGDGDDGLLGGLGRDDLTGGAGADDFEYVQPADSGVTAATRDVIHDFSHAQLDQLDLHNFDADSGTPGEQTFSFVGGNGFSAPGQVRSFLEGDHTVVALNTAGSSGAESTIQLDGHVSLSAADFIL